MKKILFVFVVLLLLAVPLAASAQTNISTYTSGFQVANLDATNTANIMITFVDQANPTGPHASVNDTVAPNSSKTFFPLTQVADGFNGSVVISSDQEVAAIANVLGNDGAHGASYVGFSGGGTTVNLPLVMKNNFGISTWFNVQNTGNSAANVTVTFQGGATQNATIQPGAAWTSDQSTNGDLAAGFVGSATIVSDEPVAATVMQVTSDTSGLAPNLLAYNGFTTADPNPVMPLITSGFYSSGTGIQIQNTGAGTTSVTVSYTPSLAGNACTETKDIPANSSVTFGFPSMPTGCYAPAGGAGSAAFVGSAAVTGNTGAFDLVAIVNQVTVGSANAAAYGAFSAGDASDSVSLPLIMQNNYGIFTGFSIVNVGTQPTNISCAFSDSGGATVSATNVAPGASLASVQDGQPGSPVLPDDPDANIHYVGSAVCTATGGDALIAGVTNQLNPGSVLPVEDGLLVYEGINN